jgi:hypothetical protein
MYFRIQKEISGILKSEKIFFFKYGNSTRPASRPKTSASCASSPVTGRLDLAGTRLEHMGATESPPEKERVVEAHPSNQSAERRRNRGRAVTFRWRWQLLGFAAVGCGLAAPG